MAIPSMFSLLLQHRRKFHRFLTMMMGLLILYGTITVVDGHVDPPVVSSTVLPMRNGQVKLSSKWSYLGPFPIGKHELDLDPTESFGGILSLYRIYQQTKRTSVPKGLISELLLNGGKNPASMEWLTIQGTVAAGGASNKYEYVQVSLNNLPVPWNQLVQQLNDMTVLEHQGWMISTITVEEKSGSLPPNDSSSTDTVNSIEVLRVRLACMGITHFYLFTTHNNNNNLFSSSHPTGKENTRYTNSTLPSLQWLAGDQYHTGNIASYHDLPEGEHLLLVRVRAKVQTNFACSATMVKTISAKKLSSSSSSSSSSVYSGLELANIVITPDIVHGVLWGDVLSLPVTNTRQQWLRDLRCLVDVSDVFTQRWHNYQDGKETEEIFTLTNIKMDEQPVTRNNRIAPGGVLYFPCRIHQSRPLPPAFCAAYSSNSIPITVRVSACANSSSSSQCNRIFSSTIQHTLRCRNLDQSTLMTFIDHDGSIQHAGVIAPLSFGTIANHTPSLQNILRSINANTVQLMEEYNQYYGLPVLLSMHGTGVSASSQADSYKVMIKSLAKDYIFGVENMWILTPSRHGAHNWQGIGQFHALQSIQALYTLIHKVRTIVSTTDFSVFCSTFRSALSCLPKVDKERILFAGHSMGGAGAWHASTSSSDFAIATAPAAGWLVKEGYSDANIFQRLDASEPLTSPFLNSILLQSVRDQRSDSHAINLQGIPAHVRVGQDDNTVPAYFSRRMVRYLEMYRAGGMLANYDTKTVTYPYLEELPKKEHWWWDTVKENDGGVLNDEKMRQFYLQNQYRLSSAAVLRLLRSTGTEGKKFLSALHSGALTHTLPTVFTYRSSNHFVYQSGRGGLRILQSSKASQASEFTVEMQGISSRWMIETKNIRRLRVDIAPSSDEVSRTRMNKDEMVSECNMYRIPGRDEHVLPSVVPFLPSFICIDNQFITLPVNQLLHLCRVTKENNNHTKDHHFRWEICYKEERIYGNNDSVLSSVAPTTVTKKKEYTFLDRERGPYNAGPLRQGLTAPYLIIVGTQDPTMENEFLSSAIYLSNMYTMAYHSYVPIIKDTDLIVNDKDSCVPVSATASSSVDTVDINAETAELAGGVSPPSSTYPYYSLPCGSNVIVLGDTHQNSWSKKIFSSLPDTWIPPPTTTTTMMMNISFSRLFASSATTITPGIGNLFLVPWKDSRTYESLPVSAKHSNLWNIEEYPTVPYRLALVLTGTDIAGYKSLLRLSEPTIPPMVRSPYTNLFPDMMMVQYEKLVREGYAGIVMTGMYGPEWSKDDDSFYTENA